MFDAQKLSGWMIPTIALIFCCFLVICSRTAIPDLERIEANQKEQVTIPQSINCETDDCTEFPKGYYSINLNGQWLYVPTSDTVREKTGVNASWLTAVSGKNGFRFEEYTGLISNAETSQILRDGLIIPDGATLNFFNCCKQLSEYYGVEGTLDVSQVRFSSFRTGGHTWPSIGSNPAHILSAEDAPEAFKGIAERYVLHVRGRDDPEAEYVEILAYSKGPLMLGGRVRISCLNLGCSISWWGNEGDQFISGRLNSVFTRTPCNTPDNCLSRESIDAHFKKLERQMADFETIINLMKDRPEVDISPAQAD